MSHTRFALGFPEPIYVKRRGRTYAEWPSGFVYFARYPHRSGVIKIGWSENPNWRLKELGMEVVSKIEIARGTKLWGTGCDSLEYLLHRRMAPHRVDPRTMRFSDRGEWYRVSVDEVATLAAQTRLMVEVPE